MTATEQAVVDQPNLRARHTLIHASGLPRKGRRYVADDDTQEIVLPVGIGSAATSTACATEQASSFGRRDILAHA